MRNPSHSWLIMIGFGCCLYPSYSLNQMSSSCCSAAWVNLIFSTRFSCPGLYGFLSVENGRPAVPVWVRYIDLQLRSRSPSANFERKWSSFIWLISSSLVFINLSASRMTSLALFINRKWLFLWWWLRVLVLMKYAWQAPPEFRRH